MIRLSQLFLCLFTCAFLSGQECVLDSTWYVDWNRETQEWDDPRRTVYYYEDGLVSETYFFTLNPVRYIYEYDSDNNKTKETQQYIDGNGVWIDHRVSTYEYYQDGIRASYKAINLDGNGIASTICTSYDSSGNRTEYKTERLIDGKLSTHTLWEYENKYNDKNQLDSIFQSEWNIDDNLWHKISRETFLYNEDGNLISELEERWEDDFNEYRILGKYEYEYEDELLVRETFLDAFFHNFQLRIRNLSSFIYDEQRRLSREDVIEFDYFTQKAESHYAYEYKYDPCGPIKERIFMRRDFITNIWQPINVKTYFYSQLTDIIEVEDMQLNIYPNPVLNELNLDKSILDGVAQIYSMDGRKLLQQNIDEDTSIDVSMLSKGNYVLRLFDGVQKHTGLFIKM